MENFVLVGIAGKAGSGKDTVANHLKAHYGFGGLAFADPIRAGMKAIVGLKDENFQHPTKEVVLPEFGKSPRQMMQTLGTDWARELVHQDFWLILAGKKIEELKAQGVNVALTDVRFENEAAFVRNSGGVIWHVKRPGIGAVNAHKSEAGVEFVDGDVIIDNSGSLQALYDNIDIFVTGVAV
jgi:dephospho-CoA kinase